MSLLPENDDDQAWADRLRDLPRSVEPERDLWPDVSERLAARAGRRRVRRIAWSAAGAMAMAAAVALVVGYVRHEGARRDALALHQANETGTVGAQAAPDPDGAGGLLPEEPAYRAAIGDLRDAFATREGDMAPDAAQAVREQLAALDDGIAEARAALAKHPQDSDLQAQLRDEYQHEIDVLSDVIDLTTRT
jgi:hypothetical protein